MNRFLLALVFALVLVGSTPTAAHAGYAAQQDATEATYDLMTLADRYWDAQGVPRCETITAWSAPSLLDGDGVDAIGRGGNCELWVKSPYEEDIVGSRYWEDAVYVCVVVFHEVGHARGLPHGSRYMAAELPSNFGPRGYPDCWKWGRSTTRSVLRGEGRSERYIKRLLSGPRRY